MFLRQSPSVGMVLALVAVLGMASAAAGKLCGDDVDGADVPCACGDVVVSSTVLDDDPVVSGAPCAHDGL